MKIKYILIFLFCISCILPSCGSRYRPLPEEEVQTDVVERELVRSRAEILSRLSELQAVTTPRPLPMPSNATAPYDLSYPANLYWEGPIEQGLASLGLRVGWRARRYGPNPAHDIIVSCDPSDTGFEVIQKFQAQAGSRARITIDEGGKTFKLNYGSDIVAGYRRTRKHRNRKPTPTQVKRTKKQDFPKVPSSHKPTLPQNVNAPAEKPVSQPQTTVQPPKDKVQSNIVTRVRPHKSEQSEAVDSIFGK